MHNCRYSNDKIVNGITHEKCSNEEIKKINHSKNDIPCIGKSCGMFEANNVDNDFSESKK